MRFDMPGALVAALFAWTLAGAPADASSKPDDSATNVVGPEQRGDAELLARFLDEGRHSSNLRLRVMIGRIPDLFDDDSPGRTSTPIDELADLARGSTDPMVLALLIAPCSDKYLKPTPTCDAVDLAQRWTLADTQNQLAWLTLSSVMRSRGDQAGSRAAFERAATASMWHEYYDEGLRAAAAVVPQALGARVRLTALQAIAGIVSAQLVPNDAVSSLWYRCKDPALREPCNRIADTIARDSGSLFSTHFALEIARRGRMDEAIVASRERTYNALQGAWIGNAPHDAQDIADSAELAAATAQIARRIELGELPFLRAMLAAGGLTETASAERYRRFRAALVQQAKSPQAVD